MSAPGGSIFLAGASGAIGQRLCRLLVQHGWRVFGTTRSTEKLGVLQGLGVEPVLVDVFDAGKLREAMLQSQPTVVIHQLTDLPDGLHASSMAAALPRNARLRDIGTRNLVSAARACQVQRVVAQSIAFAYAPGPMPYREDYPLAVTAPDEAGGLTARGVAALERQVLEGPFVGVVLRYGRVYGPRTGFDSPSPEGAAVHVDAAAEAARLSIARGHGIYNITEQDGQVSSDKAINELGWDPGFRIQPAI
jgi:nucleoside-diphosphate-sugar epimerase